MNRGFKFLAAVLALGSLLQFGGCLSSELTREVVISGVTQQAFEFLLDNDAVLDLFAD